MTRSSLWAIVFAAKLLDVPAAAQDFSGVWIHAPEGGQPVRLVLEQEPGGRVKGSLSGAGASFAIEGAVRDQTLVARSETGSGPLLVEAELTESGLDLLLASIDASGRPDYDRARGLGFVREGAARAGIEAAGPSTTAPAGAGAPDQATGSAGPGAGFSADTPLARRWDAALRGKKLTQVKSYGGAEGGYSARRELHLCSSGEFVYRSSSSVSVDVGGAFGSDAGSEAGRGRWQVLSREDLAGMDLRFADGRHWQVRLDYQGDATYADGERVYVTPGDLCP